MMPLVPVNTFLLTDSTAWPYADIGHRISSLRRDLARKRGTKIRQKDVAAGVGVAEGTVTAWEIGKQRPEGENLVRLASFLEVEPIDIVGLGRQENVERGTSHVREVPDVTYGTDNRSAEPIIHALGDPEFIRRQSGTVSRQEWADFGYQIALRRQLPPDEMKKIMKWREDILRDDA